MSKATLANWKKAKDHEITLPSGVEVSVSVPNLPDLISAGSFPNNLIDAAISFASGQTKKITKEFLTEQAEFTRKLVSLTVVSPTISESDVSDLPYEDIEMIVEIATRNRDLDALGQHLAGLEKSEKFRKFRGLTGDDEDGTGL